MKWNQRYSTEKYQDPFGNVLSVHPECIYCYNDKPEELEHYEKGAWGCINSESCAKRSENY